jgi:nucleoid-associated protein YgaU
VLLSHPQNIQWRYLLKHAQNFIETFRAIMNLLGVDIPPLDGHVQLRFLMTKKRTLDMMEFVEGFVNSEVLEAVHRRTEKVKMARMAIVEVMMKALNPKEAAKAAKRVEKEAAAVAAAVAAAIEKRKEMQAAAEAVAAAIEKRKEMQAAAEAAAEVAALAAAAAAARRKEMQAVVAAAWAMQAAAETSCVCSHVGCVKTKHARGVCRDHGPRCNHDGCKKNVYVGGICKRHHQLK